MDGGSWAREMVNLVHLEENWLNHVVSDQFEFSVAQVLDDIGSSSCKEVIEAEHIVPLLQQAIAQMRTNKARTTSYKNSRHTFYRLPFACGVA